MVGQSKTVITICRPHFRRALYYGYIYRMKLSCTLLFTILHPKHGEQALLMCGWTYSFTHKMCKNFLPLSHQFEQPQSLGCLVHCLEQMG